MAKASPRKLTGLEAVIMDCVWDLSKATVREVKERLDGAKPMAYNTVLTMMRILRDKGFLASRRDGRTDVYRPRVSREQMGRRNLHDVLERFFAGSPAALVSELLEAEDFSEEAIKGIRREVNSRLRAEATKRGTRE